MAKSIENLENAFDEMFDFITDLPSGLDGFESDFDSAFEELRELKATLTPPNAVPPCYQPDVTISVMTAMTSQSTNARSVRCATQISRDASPATRL